MRGVSGSNSYSSLLFKCPGLFRSGDPARVLSPAVALDRDGLLPLDTLPPPPLPVVPSAAVRPRDRGGGTELAVCFDSPLEASICAAAQDSVEEEAGILGANERPYLVVGGADDVDSN